MQKGIASGRDQGPLTQKLYGLSGEGKMAEDRTARHIESGIYLLQRILGDLSGAVDDQQFETVLRTLQTFCRSSVSASADQREQGHQKRATRLAVVPLDLDAQAPGRTSE